MDTRMMAAEYQPFAHLVVVSRTDSNGSSVRSYPASRGMSMAGSDGSRGISPKIGVRFQAELDLLIPVLSRNHSVSVHWSS